jgi:hypothetical protein
MCESMLRTIILVGVVMATLCAASYVENLEKRMSKLENRLEFVLPTSYPGDTDIDILPFRERGDAE